MKKIVQCILMTVALGVPGAVLAQEEANPAGEEAAAMPENSPESARQRAAALEKQIGEMKETSRSFNAAYERFKAEVVRFEKRVAELEEKVKERREKFLEVKHRVFVFDVVPLEARDAYERAGMEKVKKVTKLLNSKDVAEQIEGVAGFEEIFDGYQGVPGYKAALDLYKKTLKRYEKKWTEARDKAQRDRQKMADAARDKAEAAEQALYRRTSKKMEAAGKDIEKDWFAPTGGMMSSKLMLDLLLQRVRSASRIATSEPEDDAEKIVDALRTYWNVMDEAMKLMTAGEPDKAAEMVNECQYYDVISSARHRSMPEPDRRAIRDQHTKIREALRRHSSDIQRAERDVENENKSLENEVVRFIRSVERMDDMLEQERKEQERKAEEEAARKAEEEAARQAEEEERKAEAAETAEDSKEVKEDANAKSEEKTTKKKKKRKKGADNK